MVINYLTVTIQVVFIPFFFAVIVVFPFFFAVTFPFLFTVATFLLLLVQAAEPLDVNTASFLLFFTLTVVVLYLKQIPLDRPTVFVLFPENLFPIAYFTPLVV